MSFFPVKIVTCEQATSIETKDVEFNADFIARMLDRIEWIVLVNAATSVSIILYLFEGSVFHLCQFAMNFFFLYNRRNDTLIASQFSLVRFMSLLEEE